MVDLLQFLLPLLLLVAPNIAATVTPKPVDARPAAVERAAEAPPVPTPSAEVPRVTPAD